jgi:hypothetical protein
MKTPKASVALPDSRQLKLLFETGQLSGLSAAERSKIRVVLAQILMQAAGLVVDDGR